MVFVEVEGSLFELCKDLKKAADHRRARAFGGGAHTLEERAPAVEGAAFGTARRVSSPASMQEPRTMLRCRHGEVPQHRFKQVRG